MAVKRRIIWMTDEEWSLAKKLATEHGTTISQVVRVMLAGKAARADFESAMADVQAVAATPPDKLARVADDLRTFSSRPFTPVPKTKTR